MAAPLSSKKRVTSYQKFCAKCGHNQLFDNLSETEREYLYRISDQRDYRHGETIFLSGDRCKDFYIVVSGQLLLQLDSGKVKRYERGDLFGEISVINDSPRMGTVVAKTNCELIRFRGEHLYAPNIIPVNAQLNILRELAAYVVTYLDDEYTFDTDRVLAKGEGIGVEFKSTLSRTTKQKILETICAFLNTRGGIILVGVSDEGKVLGLGDLSPKKLDEKKISIGQMLSARTSTEVSAHVRFHLEQYGDKHLLRINCSPAHYPVIYHGDSEDTFFYRSGSSNVSILRGNHLRQLLTYALTRFK